MQTLQPVQYPEHHQSQLINMELIKNNNQVPFIRKNTTCPSPPKQLITFQPIEMTTVSPNKPIISHQLIPKNINSNPYPQNLSTHNQLVPNTFSHPPNLGKVIVVPTPGAQTIVVDTRRQSGRKSNSSSRVASRDSRIQYLQVSDEPYPARLNTQRVNNVGPMPIPPAYMTGDKKTFMSVNPRPPSNISNKSSHSRNSVEQKKPQKINITIGQSKSLQGPHFQLPLVKKPISPSKLIPSQPPVSMIQNYNQFQTQMRANTNQGYQYQQLPVQSKPGYSSFVDRGQKIADYNYGANTNVNTVGNNYMHVSDVRVVYQRGSFSPNENSSNQASRNHMLGQRSQSPKPPSFNSYHVSAQHQEYNQAQPSLNTNNQQNRHKVEMKSSKIPISELKQKKTEEISTIGPIQNKKQEGIVPLSIKHDREQHFTNLNEQKQTYGERKKEDKINQANGFQNFQSKHIGNKVSSIVFEGPYMSQELPQKGQVLRQSDNISQTQFSSSKQMETNGIHVDSPIPSKVEIKPIQSSLYQENVVKNAQSRQIGGASASIYIGNPKKVYKSYEQYMEETKKPQKIIQQIQNSEQATQINIEYRLADKKQNEKQKGRTNNVIKAYMDGGSKQTQEKVENNKKVVYTYQSIPIPTVYGDVKLKDGNAFKTNTQQNEQSRNYERNQGNSAIQILTNYYGYDTLEAPVLSAQVVRQGEEQNKQTFQRNQRGEKKSFEKFKQQQFAKIKANVQKEQVQSKQQLANNTKTVGNISTIRQRSQYSEYDRDMQYQYSSSFIGESLQENLRVVNNEDGTQLSDFQPQSWTRIKAEQSNSKIRGQGEAFQQIFSGNYGDRDRANQQFPVSNTCINRDTQIGGNNKEKQKLNPFSMIEQEHPYKINGMKPQNNTKNAGVGQLKYVGQNEKQRRRPTDGNKQQSNILNALGNQVLVSNNALNNYSNSNYQNYDFKQSKRNAQPQQYNNIYHNNNSISTKNYHHDFVPYSASQNIIPKIQEQRTHKHTQSNGAAMNSNNMYINSQKQVTDNFDNNMSTKDRISSQKLIQRNTLNYYHNRIEQEPNHRPRMSQQHISNRNVNTHIENEEDIQQRHAQYSFDVYELIDNIYNRQLQNGLAKIRQTFGRVMANFGKDDSQYENRYC